MSTGTRILVFGILGIICCPLIFSTLALIQGNQALNSGALEESDRNLANIGRILGIIGLVLMVVSIVVNVVMGGALLAGLQGASVVLPR